MGDCSHSWIVRHSFKAAFIVSCVVGLLFAAVVSGRAPDVPKLFCFHVDDVATLEPNASRHDFGRRAKQVRHSKTQRRLSAA